MGGNCTKLKPESSSVGAYVATSNNMAPSTERNDNNSDVDSDFTVESIKRDDLMVIEVIKRELKEYPSVFVLNNMLMAVQFFTNHKEVIKRLQHVSVSPQEKEMNKTLLKDETMECTYPDAIMDEVNKNVIFREPGENSQSQILVPKRIYVINDLIEVTRSGEVHQYTSIDKPCYQVKIEEGSRKGFVKLQQIEHNSPLLKEYDENYDPSVPGPSSRSDSDYEYLRITELRTPKPIQVQNNIERRDTLPESCFTTTFVTCNPKKDLDLEDDLEDNSQDDILNELDVDDFIKKIIYINSNGFMKYFQNGLFPITLGKSLGFTEEAIQNAKAIPGKVFCKEVDSQTGVHKDFEVIPAVAISWPDDQTIEFVYREDRPTIVDTRTGFKYQWPTTGPGGMIEEIRNLTAVLVPKGYTKKKGVNKNENLEWEINFPKAERYLEARMSHAQMKCMLLLLTLHKTFIQPVTEQNGLLPEHIRTHMFWECERDYRNWPEHRLGTKILSVIKNLQQRLFLGVLPDYFIKDRNIFDNIPKKYLNFAQKVLLNILDNPLPYFLKALGNLRYCSGKFYQPLDTQGLYEKLTCKDSAAQENPQLALNIVPQYKKRMYKDPDRMVKHLKYLKKKEQVMRQRVQEQEETKVKEQEEIPDKQQINLDEHIDKEMDLWKTRSILVQFIETFIAIGKKSSNVATNKQALFYFKQATYLTKILEDTAGAFLDETREWRRVIAKEEAIIKRRSVRSGSLAEERPMTPMRNSMSYNESNWFGSIRVANGMGPPPALRNLKPPNLQRSDSNKPRKTVVFLQ